MRIFLYINFCSVFYGHPVLFKGEKGFLYKMSFQGTQCNFQRKRGDRKGFKTLTNSEGVIRPLRVWRAF